MKLFDYGFDVFIANKRGTFYGRKHDTLDPNSAAYWDWATDEIATDDIPFMVNTILEKKNGEGVCQKVSIMTNSLGGQEALVMLAKLPVDSAKYISQVVNTVPCPIPLLSDTIFSLFADNDDRRRILEGHLDDDKLTALSGMQLKSQRKLRRNHHMSHEEWIAYQELEQIKLFVCIYHWQQCREFKRAVRDY